MTASRWASRDNALARERLEALDPDASPRRRIIRAMAETAAERGYHGAQLETVRARAGVEEREFAQHFRDKEDCFLGALNGIIGESMAVIADVSPQGRPKPAVARDGLGRVLDMLASRPAFARIAFVEARASTQAALEVYMRASRILASALGRSWGTPASPPPVTVARAALGASAAVITREIAAGRTEQLPAQLPAVVYGTLVPFFGQEVALREMRMADASLPGGATP
jgi:AcrR family transcriptional regulator